MFPAARGRQLVCLTVALRVASVGCGALRPRSAALAGTVQSMRTVAVHRDDSLPLPGRDVDPCPESPHTMRHKDNRCARVGELDRNPRHDPGKHGR